MHFPKPSGVFTVDDTLLFAFPSHNAADRALDTYLPAHPGAYSHVLCEKHPTEPAGRCGLCSCGWLRFGHWRSRKPSRKPRSWPRCRLPPSASTTVNCEDQNLHGVPQPRSCACANTASARSHTTHVDVPYLRPCVL